MKAFMTTRVGDVFFLLGILALWSVVGNVTFVDIYKAIGDGKFNNLFALGIPLATFAGFSIFMGTMGNQRKYHFKYGFQMRCGDRLLVQR